MMQPGLCKPAPWAMLKIGEDMAVDANPQVAEVSGGDQGYSLAAERIENVTSTLTMRSSLCMIRV
ncbi:MAG: hypothetical protein ABIG44_14510 [Planctomycetota bacterium]